MSYQNVGTPRFYINHLDRLQALGEDLELATVNVAPQGDVIGTDLMEGLHQTSDFFRSRKFVAADDTGHISLVYITPSYQYIEPMDCCILLGHNLGANSNTRIRCKVRQYVKNEENHYEYNDPAGFENLKNADFEGNTFRPAKTGFSIVKWDTSLEHDNVFNYNRIYIYFKNADGTNLKAGDSFKLSGLFFGRIYDMPFSPDLNLSLSYEFDGVKTTKTRGGATLTNTSYLSPPSHGDYEYFINWGGVTSSRKLGRRVWDLSFSYMSDEDLAPSTFTTYEKMRHDNNFYSQVIHKTLGGSLPFIFQPDNTNFDDFAIARFDMKSFKMTQKAHGVYNIKLKIRESW